MSTLESAINSESATDSSQKTTQLAFLSSNAKALSKSDLEHIMEGNIENRNETLHDIHGIRDLMTYRIQEHLPILPFSGLTKPDEPKPLLF